MKKTVSLMASMAGIAMIGGAAYVLMSDKRTNQAKKVVNTMMDDANRMMDKKLDKLK